MIPALETLTQLLRQEIGLDAESLGLNAIDHVMRSRMRATGCATPEQYLAKLNTPEERAQLVEAVVVPETWFFRQQEAFDALLRYVEGQWMPRHTGRPLNILSAPCSTGEEPYSMAMSLVDSGFPPSWINLHALDISERALAKAREGLYHEYSFRRGDLAFRDRHFRQEGRGYRLDRAVCRLVNFGQRNLLTTGELPLPQSLDVVFCRNLLIYLETAAQDQLVNRLFELLVPGGLLICAPAESSIVARNPRAIMAGGGAFTRCEPGAENWGWASARTARTSLTPAVSWPSPTDTPSLATPAVKGLKSKHLPATGKAVGRNAVAIGAAMHPAPPAPRQHLSTAPPTPAGVGPAAKPTAAGKPLGSARQVPRGTTKSASPEPLDHARALADAGRLTRAIEICRQFLVSNPHSIAGHYLQGLLHDAAGHRTTAAASYRRAIYLDPNHVDALLHLASLLALQGDKPQAEQLRQRAARAWKRIGNPEVKGT